jgi:hypothetical protein
MPRTKPSSSPTRLTLINAAPAPEHPAPPGKLGETGMTLWRAVTTNYAFDDPGSVEILFQACAAAERAETCRRIVDQDGELIRTQAGTRSHPLLRDELNNRTFVVRALGKLGLDLEPVRAMGRPPGR